ncbi:bifunctional 4-hydroxy-2-oxoglutarate aldolase/2-dehydro-3-deoxy-phosphogluconate aldolase [Homoserinibacter sp. GY 40078]|uniref:bifunctional 4-hydroxy-2-oxoglutarate aldolase/2-dehydro-3-deoxy-phosphogluconate aldolase n=1 Tax=Homoserinibacter sp. GY 40078 TaxID=2603275 RepID=UPI0011CB78B0|nr:bifunctional 4-hydroxy-2-oxoglutarate aldolase/2-dehydro-3-deoxy-phosphogluconate aldolase [Homoserinibacter sp. GY 40078]TXK19522.1 bifunctional 4-hydroxy-2-oxoglutarate aldolase/2-dehydro-3-deoxy-phosphogluconate aldolase [Homoserinibacter sp. GY 40078]
MGTKSGDDALNALATHRLVPVIALDSAEQADPLAAALVAGGLPVAEVTFRTAAAAESIRIMSERGDVLVGAGTVITPQQVDTAVDAGAQFVVSPGLSASVVERCRERGIPVLPGAVTATEVQAALELGIETVKFFPAGTSGGARAIAALSAPFGSVRFVPTGGIGVADLGDYLDIPQVIAVGGSWMVPADAIRGGQWDRISTLSADAVAAAHRARP